MPIALSENNARLAFVGAIEGEYRFSLRVVRVRVRLGLG